MRDMPLTFGDFTLDPANRTLLRGGQPVEISARYLDALVLLAREPGELVTKDRFMDEVWRGVPVTDDALTQAIRALRKALGDDAASPRFIETVPKHGYRFVAPVHAAAKPKIAREEATSTRAGLLRTMTAGALGAALAGVLVGLFYGAQAGSVDSGRGSALSIVLVVVVASVAAAAISGMGIATGVAASRFVQPPARWWATAGGAVGGIVTGALASLVLSDGFALLTGSAPTAMTGVLEGAVIGTATGLGVAATGGLSVGYRVTACAVIGGSAGLLVHLAGGALMGDSLAGLLRSFPQARLQIGSALPPSVNAALEGAVFVACVAAAILRSEAKEKARPFAERASLSGSI